MTDRPTVHPPLPGRPGSSTTAGESGDGGEPAAVALPLVAAVARGVALVVVLPVRLLWELIEAAGRLVHRHLLTPVGRFLRRWLLAPLVWCVRHLLWLPLVWAARTLVWIPLVWSGRGLAWVARTLIWLPLVWVARSVLRPPLVGLGRVLVWLTGHLVVRPLTWLGEVLAPAGRLLWRGVGVLVGAAGAALVWLLRGIWWIVAGCGRLVVAAWRTAGRVLGFLHRLLLRPLLLGVRWVWSVTVVPVARGVRAAWRATVSPVARWIRRSVLDPARLASREVLTALGLRR
ncbi:hypothetical protein ABZS77_11455 [Micromonospora sp. NPDC005298]|uniref:hypothetical protein n=1 Tax=Micromonospora sp. NPDC005298 TaxID=3156873 RepID=UPI0033B56522